MKPFHRLTVSLTDEEMKILEELRRESGESLSKIFRDAIYIYYKLVKASRVAGVDFRKYFTDIARLAFHIHGVEQKQFAVIDRELYRVLLKKLQENVDPESIERDEEFRAAVSGLVKLFEVTRGEWEKWEKKEKLEEILSTLEFAGAGFFAKVGDGEYIFSTYAESTSVTKVILSAILSSAGIDCEVESSPGKIFVRLR
ncbi:MAG: ribbon-helix-helix protein, CopG family [Archaeoglobaceae archaeon]